MKLKDKTYLWIIGVCFVLCGSLSASAQIRSSYPTYTVHHTPSTVHRNPYPVTGNPYPVTPTYEFRSTSVYMPTTTTSLNLSRGTSSGIAGLNRVQESEFSWGREESDEQGVGEIADPTPVGSPLILLLFAVGYYFFRRRKRAC